jgi:isopenicillin-N epimerase
LLIVDAVTSPTGLVLPVPEIVAAARERGVLVLVDGAHAPGQLPVDLGTLAPDWWVGNLHKWLCAPKGAAVLWSAPRHRARTTAAVPSHGSGLGYHDEFDWPGTFDPTAWLTIPAALDLHAALGGEALQARNHALVQTGRQVLAAATGRPLPHPDDPSLYAAMASLALGLPERLAEPLNRHLWQSHRIEVPVSPLGGDCILRISGFAGYNTHLDYERLAAVLPGAIDAVSRRQRS